MKHRLAAVAATLLAAGCVLVGGCHKTSLPDAAATPATATSATTKANDKTAEKRDTPEGVILTPEERRRVGVVTQLARATQYADEVAGYGVVVSHDTIAQAAAELATAQATERLSRSAWRRAKQLEGTPGAMSADVLETAAQKAQVDEAALTLTTQRLSTVLGLSPPWKGGDKASTLQQLASGQTKLVRATFPLGALSGAAPSSLRATHIGRGAADGGWKMTVIWDAPADASIPGRSFFALLKRSDAGEGERLQVWAPVGAMVAGIDIPAAAAVMSEGRYWCYLETKPGTFVRTPIDTSRPLGDGYIVTQGVAADTPVVTAAAGQLLAKELGSGADPD